MGRVEGAAEQTDLLFLSHVIRGITGFFSLRRNSTNRLPDALHRLGADGLGQCLTGLPRGEQSAFQHPHFDQLFVANGLFCLLDHRSVMPPFRIYHHGIQPIGQGTEPGPLFWKSYRFSFIFRCGFQHLAQPVRPGPPWPGPGGRSGFSSVVAFQKTSAHRRAHKRPGRSQSRRRPALPSGSGPGIRPGRPAPGRRETHRPTAETNFAPRCPSGTCSIFLSKNSSRSRSLPGQYRAEWMPGAPRFRASTAKPLSSAKAGIPAAWQAARALIRAFSSRRCSRPLRAPSGSPLLPWSAPGCPWPARSGPFPAVFSDCWMPIRKSQQVTYRFFLGLHQLADALLGQLVHGVQLLLEKGRSSPVPWISMMLSRSSITKLKSTSAPLSST